MADLKHRQGVGGINGVSVTRDAWDRDEATESDGDGFDVHVVFSFSVDGFAERDDGVDMAIEIEGSAAVEKHIDTELFRSKLK